MEVRLPTLGGTQVNQLTRVRLSTKGSRSRGGWHTLRPSTNLGGPSFRALCERVGITDLDALRVSYSHPSVMSLVEPRRTRHQPQYPPNHTSSSSPYPCTPPYTSS